MAVGCDSLDEGEGVLDVGALFRLCLWNGDLGGFAPGRAILWRIGYSFSMVVVKYSDSLLASSVILELEGMGVINTGLFTRRGLFKFFFFFFLSN